MARAPSKTRLALIELTMSSRRPDAVRVLTSAKCSHGTTNRRLPRSPSRTVGTAPKLPQPIGRLSRSHSATISWGAVSNGSFPMRRGGSSMLLRSGPPGTWLATLTQRLRAWMVPAKDGRLTGWLPANAPVIDMVCMLHAPIATARATSRVIVPGPDLNGVHAPYLGSSGPTRSRRCPDRRMGRANVA